MGEVLIWIMSSLHRVGSATALAMQSSIISGVSKKNRGSSLTLLTLAKGAAGSIAPVITSVVYKKWEPSTIIFGVAWAVLAAVFIMVARSRKAKDCDHLDDKLEDEQEEEQGEPEGCTGNAER